MAALDTTLTVTVQAAMKHPFRSKVLWVNVLVLCLLAAEEKLNFLQPLLPVNVYAAVAFVLPVVNAALRFFTTQGLLGLIVGADKAQDGQP